MELALAERGPFVVGARMADERRRIDHSGRRRPEKLDLLAAHYVGAAVAEVGNARNDGLALARADELGHDFVDAGRARNVRRFLPPAVGADHSGQQQGLVAKPLADFVDRVRETTLGNRQDALAVLELLDVLARRVDQVGPAVRRAPVDRDESVRPAHACRHGRNNRQGASSLPVFFSRHQAIPRRVSAESPVQCVADVHAVLGEGPVWVARETALYWLDIKGRKIFRLDDRGERQEWPTPLRVGSLAPRKSGGFIGGTEEGIFAIDPEAGRFDLLLDPEEELPGNRFNDGKLDRQGRFWAGSMDDSERSDSGTLYRIGRDLDCVAIDRGYRVTNGPAFSPDGKLMYHNDSARQVTYVFDLDGDSVGERRTFLQ